MWFHWRLSILLLRRYPGAALQVAAVVFTLTLGVVASGIVALGVWRDLDRQSANLHMDVVLQDDVSDSSAFAVLHSMESMPSVAVAGLYSPQSVWKALARTTGVRADDLADVVDMPPIVRCRLTPQAANLQVCQQLDAQLQEAHGDVIRDVVWSKDMIAAIDARRQDVRQGAGIAALVWLLVTVSGMAYAYRAIVMRSRTDLRVAAVMGASPSFGAAPYAMATALAALAGSALAATVAAVAWPAAVAQRTWLGWVSAKEIAIALAALALVAMLEAWWQSWLAARHQAKPVRTDRAA